MFTFLLSRIRNTKGQMIGLNPFYIKYLGIFSQNIWVWTFKLWVLNARYSLSMVNLNLVKIESCRSHTSMIKILCG